jgi:hypothetical protein
MVESADKFLQNELLFCLASSLATLFSFRNSDVELRMIIKNFVLRLVAK